MEFYHLDRSGSLKIGDELSLNPASVRTNLPGLECHLTGLFPKGVSKHGWQYSNQSDTKDVHCEWFFEYVRRAKFSDKPSRFESVFAVSTMNDIDRLQKMFNINDNYDIYLLECDSYFRTDMNLIGHQSSPLLMSWLANIYWSGETCEELNSTKELVPLWEYLLIGDIKVVDKCV